MGCGWPSARCGCRSAVSALLSFVMAYPARGYGRIGRCRAWDRRRTGGRCAPPAPGRNRPLPTPFRLCWSVCGRRRSLRSVRIGAVTVGPVVSHTCRTRAGTVSHQVRQVSTAAAGRMASPPRAAAGRLRPSWVRRRGRFPLVRVRIMPGSLGLTRAAQPRRVSAFTGSTGFRRKSKAPSLGV